MNNVDVNCSNYGSHFLVTVKGEVRDCMILPLLMKVGLNDVVGRQRGVGSTGEMGSGILVWNMWWGRGSCSNAKRGGVFR